MEQWIISQVQVLQRQVQELQNRMTHLFQLGTSTTTTDEDTGTATVQVQHNPYIVHSDIAIAQQFGLASSPPLGSALLTLNMSGMENKKIVVGSHNDSLRPTGTPSGGTVIYDQSGTKIGLPNNGTVTISIGGNQIMLVTQDGVFVTGTVTATGDVIGHGISLDTHEHESSASGHPTGEPIA